MRGRWLKLKESQDPKKVSVTMIVIKVYLIPTSLLAFQLVQYECMFKHVYVCGNNFE